MVRRALCETRAQRKSRGKLVPDSKYNRDRSFSIKNAKLARPCLRRTHGGAIDALIYATYAKRKGTDIAHIGGIVRSGVFVAK